MKKILTIIFVAFSTMIYADNDPQMLVLWMKNGEKVRFALEDEPHTKFADGKLLITSNTISISYDLDKVRRYTYEGYATPIEAVPMDGLNIRQNGDEIYLSGLANGTTLQLFDTKGALLQTKRVDNEKMLNFSLAQHPAGVYIVKMGDQSLKFYKK